MKRLLLNLAILTSILYQVYWINFHFIYFNRPDLLFFIGVYAFLGFMYRPRFKFGEALLFNFLMGAIGFYLVTEKRFSKYQMFTNNKEN